MVSLKQGMRKSLLKHYRRRKLAEGYPDLERVATAHYSETPMGTDGVRQTMNSLERITSLPAGNKKVVVVGCGPMPFSLPLLKEMGYDPIGVEPVPGFVENARRSVGEESGIRVLEGAAEDLPLKDESVALVLLESVLEHVESPSKSLAEAYRVLAPGGVVSIETSNWPRFHPLGRNGEYNLPFYNYYPRLVKEAIIHHHLHYQPKLANYSPRPAVHWFSYADLCARGREAGFHRFYARFDGMDPEDEAVAKTWLRRRFLRRIQLSPFFRSLALLQYGGAIFMLKRP